MKSYRLLIHLFLPFIFIYTAKIAFRYRSLRYFLQRLGFLYPAVNKNRVWIHCASVGEVNTAMPLIKLLLENHPDQEILITTVTPTGAEIVARNKLAGLVHCYLPVDLYFCVNRFMKKIKPGLALILETELWPELYYQCNRQNAAITIINARLSKRTLQANNWMKNQYQSALSLVDRVLARSEDDKKGFIQLGCTVEKIEVLGNLKFAHESNLAPVEIDNFTLRPFVLLASSHNDEEMQFARMWQSIDSRNRLLVIAPRHPERGPGIANELQGLGLNIALRSRQDVITDDTEVYVADTLGELTGFMAMAELVFMGGR